jgi:hypothetical protein
MPSSSTSPQHDTANNNKGDGKHSLPVYDIPVADIPVADSSDRGPTVFLSKVPRPPDSARDSTIISPRSLKKKLGGGHRKKRTRKHKKYAPISNSNRPTRRRNIKPNSDSHHKYTRKRPRT